MVNRLFISSFKIIKRLPKAAAGSLTLFIVINAIVLNLNCVWQLLYLYSNPASDDPIRMEAQLHLMPHEKEKYRVFLTGSSQTREDFDIGYINNQFSNCSAIYYNLGLSGNAQPIRMYMTTDSMLPMRPDIVIYMPFIGSLYSNYDYTSMPYNFEEKIIPLFFEYVKPDEIYMKGEYFLKSITGKYLPIYRYRDSIKTILMSYFGDTFHGTYRSKTEFHAYTNNLPDQYFEDEVRKAGGNKYTESPYTDFNKKCFKLFAHEIINSGARLVVIKGPTHPRLMECFSPSLDVAFDEFFDQQSIEQGFLYISQEEMPHFVPADFIDFTHLNDFGIRKMSKYLCDYMYHSNLISCDSGSR